MKNHLMSLFLALYGFSNSVYAGYAPNCANPTRPGDYEWCLAQGIYAPQIVFCQGPSSSGRGRGHIIFSPSPIDFRQLVEDMHYSFPTDFTQGMTVRIDEVGIIDGTFVGRGLLRRQSKYPVYQVEVRKVGDRLIPAPVTVGQIQFISPKQAHMIMKMRVGQNVFQQRYVLRCQ